MKFFEITKESPVHEICEKYWSINKVWDKAIYEIDLLLGCNSIEIGLKLDAGRLAIDRFNGLDDDVVKQFTKTERRGGFYAKTKSKLNKEFLEIVKKYGLYSADECDIAMNLGTAWHHGKETHYPPVDGRYYIATERKIEAYKGLVEIAEPIFLRIWADHLESKNKGGKT